MEKNYKAVKSEKLSTNESERFIIVDTESEKILDDADGYGYKTKNQAYSAFEVKLIKEKNQRIRNWIKEHPDFIETLDTFKDKLEFEGVYVKDIFDSKFIKKLFKIYGFKNLDFTEKEFLRMYLKKR